MEFKKKKWNKNTTVTDRTLREIDRGNGYTLPLCGVGLHPWPPLPSHPRIVSDTYTHAAAQMGRKSNGTIDK